MTQLEQWLLVVISSLVLALYILGRPALMSWGARREQRRMSNSAYKRELHALKTSQHLDLCLKHMQEHKQSHFAEHNCDYCKLKAQFDKECG